MVTAQDIKHAICSQVADTPVRDGVVRVTTPFLDRTGSPLHVYVRPNGEITDGSATINMLRALRCLEDFEEWPHREDFLVRYGIEERESALVAADPADPDMLLRYLQGISRLPTYFQARPIKTFDDVFPTRVKHAVRPKIRSFALSHGKTERWAEERLRERSVELKGVRMKTDFTPENPRIFVQIISYAGQIENAQMSHFSLKLLPLLLMREEEAEKEEALRHDWKMACVLSSLGQYPSAAGALVNRLGIEAVEFDRLGEEESSARIVEILASR